jgi:diguanylate cyclase (GGDEF)-like protein/PAS domain S-box-containing protein
VSSNLDAELSELRARLAESEEAIDAIRHGYVDSVIGDLGLVLPLPGAEQPYVRFFDAMNEGGVTLDHAGLILHCNPCFLAMVGRPIAALRGSPMVHCVVEEDRSRIDALLASAASASADCRLAGANGELPVHLSVTTLDSEGHDFRCLVVTDLTERAKSDAELRIAAIAFESQESMMVTDERMRIVRVNQAFTRFTGYSAAEALGRTPALLKSGRHDEGFYADMWAAIEGRKFWQGEIWNRHKNGKVYAHWLTISAVCAPSGQTTHYVGVLSQITKNHEAEAEIHRLAYYDALTGLPNRRLLQDRLQQALNGSARSGHHGAILFIDLDNFKKLNDSLGHDAGDKLLCDAARRLAAAVREVDTIARIGGDEFVVILEGLDAAVDQAGLQAQHVGEKIRLALERPFDLGAREFSITASMGASLFGSHKTTVEDLLKHADLALYKAKDSGRNALRFFDPRMQATLDHRVALENDLRLAIAREGLLVYLQPQIDAEGRIIGAEALLRWPHARLGMVEPGEFIALAEDTGMILTLGSWAMRQACERLKMWAADPALSLLQLAINVSQKQFRQRDFVAGLRQAIELSGADPTRLKIEITESMMAGDPAEALEKMHALKDIGVGISIDVFGTGYSSLSYLTQLPITQMKIDKSFVHNLPQNPRDAVVAHTIINMARSLSMSVIAEGVETVAQFDFLLSHGCDEFQGFLFGRPMPLAAFEAIVRRGDRRGE